MKRRTQKEIAKVLVKLRGVMDFLDDGHHNEEYFELVKISNELYARLNATNRKKLQDWISKKMEEDSA